MGLPVACHQAVWSLVTSIYLCEVNHALSLHKAFDKKSKYGLRYSFYNGPNKHPIFNFDWSKKILLLELF